MLELSCRTLQCFSGPLGSANNYNDDNVGWWMIDRGLTLIFNAALARFRLSPCLVFYFHTLLSVPLNCTAFFLYRITLFCCLWLPNTLSPPQTTFIFPSRIFLLSSTTN